MLELEQALKRREELRERIPQEITRLWSSAAGADGRHFDEFVKFYNEVLKPLEDEFNKSGFDILREVLDQRVGTERSGLYICAGTDTRTPSELGGEWDFIDYHYDHLRECKRVDSSPVSDAGYHPITLDVDVADPAVLGKEYDVSLIKKPGLIYTNDPPIWFESRLKFGIDTLRHGGIFVSELNLGRQIELAMSRSRKAAEVIQRYDRKVEKVTDMLGKEGLEYIDIFMFSDILADMRGRRPVDLREAKAPYVFSLYQKVAE